MNFGGQLLIAERYRKIQLLTLPTIHVASCQTGGCVCLYAHVITLLLCFAPWKPFTIKLTIQQIKIYKPHKSSHTSLSSSQYEGFSVHGSYTYHDLPSRYWRKYQYAAQFVELVRSKTPKVSNTCTMYMLLTHVHIHMYCTCNIKGTFAQSCTCV